jgi:hypothetical protein
MRAAIANLVSLLPHQKVSEKSVFSDRIQKIQKYGDLQQKNEFIRVCKMYVASFIAE